jgi:PhnB protein
MGSIMTSPPTVLSVMLIVPDAAAAIGWYQEALGATVLWDLGGVAGLAVDGSAFFLHEINPANPRETSPEHAGVTSVRIEVFVDDPDALIERAARAGAPSSHAPTEHEVPWGRHRQGGFMDPFGHVWSVGDRSPLTGGRSATPLPPPD